MEKRVILFCKTFVTICSIKQLFYRGSPSIFSVFGHLLIPHLTYENKENSHVNILRKITK